MKRKILLVTLSVLLSTSLFPQSGINFMPAKWNILRGQTDTIGGRLAFTGIAVLKDTEFRNGTIEFDLWSTGGRSYAGLVIHLQENRNSEEFYIRPHKTNGLFPDAMQYTPVYHGISCWQLFHGQRGTRSLNMPHGEWVRFRLQVEDGRALFSMIDKEGKATPMLINNLDLGDIGGGLAVKGPADGSAWFSRILITRSPDNPLPPIKKQHSVSPGAITQWEISKPLLHSETQQYGYYTNYTDLDWKKVSSDPSGFLNLTRELTRNTSQPGWLFAKTIINSESKKTVRYQLGYSDYITVFVNGRPIMSGTNAYTSRDPAYAGLIGWFDEIFVPLEKGDNELALLVGEQFGGWAIQLREAEAVRIDEGITKEWEADGKLYYPESVIYNEKQDILYATNFLGTKGGSIASLSSDGKVIESEWIGGLNRPTGLIMSGTNKLLVVERTGIAVIDIKKAVIEERIQLADPGFPNDICTGTDGNSFFISDGQKGRIYKLTGDSTEIWLENKLLEGINGIDLFGDRLIAGCSNDQTLRLISPSTGDIEKLAVLPEPSVIDGLEYAGGDLYLAGDYNGHLFLVDSKGKTKELMNLTTVGFTPANFEFIEKGSKLVIPGLYTNKIIMYDISSLLQRERSDNN